MQGTDSPSSVQSAAASSPRRVARFIQAWKSTGVNQPTHLFKSTLTIRGGHRNAVPHGGSGGARAERAGAGGAALRAVGRGAGGQRRAGRPRSRARAAQQPPGNGVSRHEALQPDPNHLDPGKTKPCWALVPPLATSS